MLDHEITRPGVQPEFLSPHLYPPNDTTWTWHEFRFESVDYQYDDWVLLKITQRRLVPAGVRD